MKDLAPSSAPTRALRSLEGLSVGDSFGQAFFSSPLDTITHRKLPDGPWPWTDDTHMALSLVELLLTRGQIDQDQLSRLFAHRYAHDPGRGYGAGAHRLLARYAQGADWRVEAKALFEGGSYGNGAAMRAPPVGAYFSGDPERAASEARKSAEVTHAHLEGQVGAIAVAVAASTIAEFNSPPGKQFIRRILEFLPQTRTREAIEKALVIQGDQPLQAVSELGTGQQIAAFDTVPYCLWVIAHHGTDFATAMWKTVAGLGDRDTTCAIVGGIMGAAADVPNEWIARREPLPAGFKQAAA